MDTLPFLHTLQLTDSFFPVGAFAYSDGLETAAAGSLVTGANGLGVWMNHFLDNVFVPCDGLGLFRAMNAFRSGDAETLRAIDLELTAIKPAGAVRASSSGIGKRLLAAYAGIASSPLVHELPHANAPAAYGVVYAHLGVSERDALLAFGYNRLTGIVSVGLRLVSIGQQQGQALLTQTLRRLPDSVERILLMQDEPLRSFNPILDIQQMNHRYVYSRLFRS